MEEKVPVVQEEEEVKEPEVQNQYLEEFCTILGNV